MEHSLKHTFGILPTGAVGFTELIRVSEIEKKTF